MLQRVRELRIKKGWSQNQLAELTGISQTTISEMENGKRNKMYNNIKKLAQVLGVTMEQLEGDDTV